MIKLLRRNLPQNSFARGVSVLVGGTAGAQALMVLASPLLTRLYTPEDFGLLAVYAGLLALVAVIASLRYELAIPLPECNIEAINVLLLSLASVLLVTCISSVLVFIFDDKIAALLESPELTGYLWLLPIGVLVAGCYKVFNYWAVRAQRFTEIATTRVNQTLTTLAIQILGFKLGGIALLVGQAAGQGVGSVRLAKHAWGDEKFRFWTFSGIKLVAKRYIDFPIFSTWSALLNTAGNQLPLILFAMLFNPGVAGAYLLTQRVLGAPITLISDSVSKVFLSNAPNALRDGRLPELVLKIQSLLAKIIIPPFFVLACISPFLFSTIFGDEWLVSGEIARWISLWLALVFILSPFMVLFEVLEQQKVGLLFQLFLLIIRISSIIIGAYFDDFLFAVQLFSCLSAAALLGFNLWLCINVGTSFLCMSKNYLTPVIFALVIASPLLFLTLFDIGAIGVYFSGLASFILLMSYYGKMYLSGHFGIGKI